MTTYIIKRVIMIIPIVLGIILILFIMLYFLPGSLVRQLPSFGGGDLLDSVFNLFNLGDNLITKYLRYCYNVLFRLDFGSSGITRQALLSELGYRIRNTMILLTVGTAAILAVGIPAGVLSAVYKNTMFDRILNVITLLFSSVPSFVIAMMTALVFAVYLKILPLLSSYTSPVAFFMPTLTIMLGGMALITRMTRAGMVEELERPYITALRAKGIGYGRVVCGHALKNALVPVIASLGGFIAQLMCSSLVVERFFNVPGLGSYMLSAAGSRNDLGILCCSVILTVILSLTNLVSDILYMLISPQIKLRNAGSSKLRRGAKNEA